MRRHPWMKARYVKMGGKYLDFFKKIDVKSKILNCGITGGRRDVMLKFLDRMIATMSDKDMVVMKTNESINLNMAALNYILYTEYGKTQDRDQKFQGNAPVHSVYKRYQTDRKDVWFVH